MTDIAERYVALWNEPDADARRAAIADLFTPDGVQLLEPPEDVRESARALAVSAHLESRGHAALERRVTRAREQFVAPGTFVFRRAEDPVVALGDAVTFRWEMVPPGGGEVAGAGREFLLVTADGRIRADYQFIDP
jgi:hypothetical protein